MGGDLWGLFLIVVGGLLAGGTISMWKRSRLVALALAACAALAVVSGALRLDYL